MAINRGTFSRLALPAKLGIGAGALLLVAGGYYFLFHTGLDESLASAEQAGVKLNADLSKARAAEQAFQKDLAELADREQRQKELNQILPATTEYPAFLSAVQSAANVSGVSLSAWTPREKVPDKYYAKVPMKVELTGKFMQIARFFYNVGQLDRIINMENISMTDAKVVDDEVMLKTEALATAFHVVEESEAGADADARKRPKRGGK